MSLLGQVVGTISRYNMFRPGARIGVAVSGGADSICLLHLLSELKPSWNLTLGVVHLNHCLRAAESDADEAFVREQAAALHLPFLAERQAIADLQDNLEQSGRLARLRFFAGLIAGGEFERIATAHTASDQAETVLYRILRGSYTTGLAGIRPLTPEGIVRPLLRTTRAEVECWLRDRGLPWREDSTNRDLSFDRNRIRHVLLPSLAAEWNPQLPSILARHAELAREDDEHWEAETDRLAPGRLRFGDAQVILDVQSLAGLHRAVARRLIRRAIAHVRGDLRQIDFGHIDSVLDLLGHPGQGHARIQVPGVDVLRSFHLVRFSKPGSVPRPEYAIPIDVPGTARLPGDRGEIRLEVVAAKSDSSDRDTMKVHLEGSRLRQMQAGLVVRNWYPGDRYRRAGHTHEQKLKELFHDFRVPLWERSGWPVLASGERILWVRRFGPAADVAAGPESAGAIRVLDRDA